MGAKQGKISGILQSQAKKEELEKTFRAYDVNKDGCISKGELESFLVDLFAYFATLHPDDVVADFFDLPAGHELRKDRWWKRTMKEQFSTKKKSYSLVDEGLLETILGLVDSSGDGKIQVAEFLSFPWNQLLEKVHAKWLEAEQELRKCCLPLVGHWKLSGRNSWGNSAVIGEPDEWRFSFTGDLVIKQDETTGDFEFSSGPLSEVNEYDADSEKIQQFVPHLCVIQKGRFFGHSKETFGMDIFINWQRKSYFDKKVYYCTSIEKISDNEYYVTGTNERSEDARTNEIYGKSKHKWTMTRI